MHPRRLCPFPLAHPGPALPPCRRRHGEPASGETQGHRAGAPFQCGCSLLHRNPGPVLLLRPSPCAFCRGEFRNIWWPLARVPPHPTLVPPQISVTSGVVSRIEVTAYAHGATELLGVQIDAAINSGNSGGCGHPPPLPGCAATPHQQAAALAAP